MSIPKTPNKPINGPFIDYGKEALLRHILIRDGFSPSFIYYVCRAFSSVFNFWTLPTKLLREIISGDYLDKITNIVNKYDLSKEQELLSKQKVNIVVPEQKEYPSLLSHIYRPPILLYYRGNIQQLNDSFTLAIVGSRKISEYGRRSIAEIVSGLSTKNVSIISGLAIGADACAHEYALKNHLITIAVLGSGISDENIYPRCNFNLAQKILSDGGAIVSTYPPDIKPRPEQFPARNRIIAGISRAVLVAEAANNSGSLITANFALEENRDVWAVPGSIFDALSSGTNKLIYKGAKPAISAQAILDDYLDIQQKSVNKLAATSGPRVNEKISNKILELLNKNKMDIEEIFLSIKEPADKINLALTSLEFSDKIIIESGVCYSSHLTKLKND